MFLPPQMHLEGLERVKNFSFYPLKQNLKENPGPEMKILLTCAEVSTFFSPPPQ